jgi:hypothetical protein
MLAIANSKTNHRRAKLNSFLIDLVSKPVTGANPAKLTILNDELTKKSTFF